MILLPSMPPPQAYSAVPAKPSATGRLLKAGIAVLIAGALLLLLGAAGAFYFWNNNEKHVRRPLSPVFTIPIVIF